MVGRRSLAALALLFGLAGLLGLLAGATGVGHAGGGRLAPVGERYEPGDRATLVGYTAGPADGPFYAYLRPAGTVPRARLLDSDWYVGQIVVDETAHGGYLRLRVSLAFDVPTELEPGHYEVVYCDDPCTGAPLGDLVPSPLSIGVDPARPVVREWALDDPEIPNLGPGALLVGPGFSTTAAQLREPARPPVAGPQPASSVPQADPAPAPPPGAVAADDDMDWSLPTVLVLAAAAGTWLALARRERTARGPVTPSAPPPPAGGRRRGAAAAGGR